MRIHLVHLTRLALFILMGCYFLQAQKTLIVPITPALLQVPAALQEQLKARYPALQATKKTVKDICKNGGPPATITIQRSDLSLYAGPKEGTCSGRWKDGQLKFACGIIPKPGERPTGKEKVNLVQLRKGDKVFSNGIFPDGDFVSLGLGSCSGPQKDTLGVLGFTFQFPKDYLLTASADDVEKVMAEFFVRDGSDQRTQVKEGQPIEQVVAAFGQPQEKLRVGNKEIYIYKDVKITLLDGNVSSIEPTAGESGSGKR